MNPYAKDALEEEFLEKGDVPKIAEAPDQYATELADSFINQLTPAAQTLTAPIPPCTPHQYSALMNLRSMAEDSINTLLSRAQASFGLMRGLRLITFKQYDELRTKIMAAAGSPSKPDDAQQELPL